MSTSQSLGEKYRKAITSYFEKKLEHSESGINNISQVLEYNKKRRFKSEFTFRDWTKYSRHLINLLNHSKKEAKTYKKLLDYSRKI